MTALCYQLVPTLQADVPLEIGNSLLIMPKISWLRMLESASVNAIGLTHLKEALILKL